MWIVLVTCGDEMKDQQDRRKDKTIELTRQTSVVPLPSKLFQFRSFCRCVF